MSGVPGSPFTPDPTRSGRGDDDSRTLVIDEEPEGRDESVRGASRPRASRPPLPRLRLIDPSSRGSAGAGAAAGALTILLLLATAVSITRVADLRAVSQAPQASAERVLYWTPDALENPEDPAAEERSAPAPRPRAAASTFESSASTPSSLPPAARDTAQGGDVGARPTTEGLLRPIVPTGAIPSADRLGSAAAGAAARGAPTGCAPPCREAAVVGIAPGAEMARRDSILQSRMAQVVDRAGPAQKPAGFQVGLPGGGPTKEERQRDSTLHAEYRARLQAFMQRYDSAKADSLARGLIKPGE